MSGEALLGSVGSAIMSDVECYARVMGVSTEQVGGCSVVAHPEWGMALYPCCIVVCNIGEEAVREALIAISS